MRELRETAERIAGIASGMGGREGPRAVVGFDGFVDEMGRVVAERAGVERWTAVGSIAQFAGLIGAATGRSMGREIVVERTEAGGNGPNFAGGLVSLGVEVEYYGTLGSPRHTVFDAFAARCARCVSLGTQHGRTLALEFADGKLMFNMTAGLAELNAELLERAALGAGYREACAGAGLIGLANWSLYPHMTECWDLVQERVLAGLSHRPWLMIDLADPSGRRREDVVRMLGVVSGFERHARTVLGVNLNEAGVLLGALGSGAAPVEESEVWAGAAAGELRRCLGVEMVVVHGRRCGAVAWSGGSRVIPAVLVERPVRTTGVGDRFNAGFGLGLLAGLDGAGCLAVGMGAGGWFVRTGREATAGDVVGILNKWADGALTG